MKSFARIALATAGLLLAGQVPALTNPNFAAEQTFAGSGDEFAGPDGWLLRDLETRRAVVSTVDFAQTGERVFWFETLTGGFGDNKLEQCVALDDPAAFALTAVAQTGTPDSDLRLRLNVEFYTSQADCDNRDDRLDDAEDDFRLDGAANSWTAFTLNVAPPPAASHARLSVRARDRSGAGNNPAEVPKFIFIDRVEAPGSNLVNADFSQTTLTLAEFGQDQGPFGWTLRSVSDRGLVMAEPTAEQGAAFRFSALDEGFGDNTVEQCVDISALDPFVFDVRVRPNLGDSDLRIRLAVDYHANRADCLARDNRIDDVDFDVLTSDLAVEDWNAVRSGLLEAPTNANWARIALRARDRRTAGPDPVILFDQVALTDRFFVGGTLSGLADGSSLVLDNNGEPLSLEANGAFAFPTGLPHGQAYLVSVETQPVSPSQTCQVSQGAGQISADDVDDIQVTCETDRFTIGGELSGLVAGAELVIQLNGHDDLTLTTNGGFQFPGDLADGSSYLVSVAQNPQNPSQTCTVANGEGVLSGAPVDDVQINCATELFSIGGSLSGLVDGTTLVLQNAGADDLNLSANGSFVFAQPVADGGPYAVTVLTQPGNPNQNCTVSNGSGVVSGADVDDVEVNCERIAYPVGGTLSGLAPGASVVLQNNGGDDLSLSSNGSFEFSSPLPDGESFMVTVSSQPTTPSQSCSVSGGQGQIVGGPVTTVEVSCVNDAFFLGGSLSGLVAGNTLSLTSGTGQTLDVSGNGAFVFADAIGDGASYEVAILAQSASLPQSCSIGNGSGVIAGADVTNVQINCQAGPPPGSARPGRADVTNPRFAAEQAFAGGPDTVAGPSGWLLRDLDDRRGLVSGFDGALSGQRVFRFENPTSGFGDNKLEQCLPVSDPTGFALRVHTQALQAAPGLAVRLNVESYPTEADCLARDNRLDNEDFDFPLDAISQTWLPLDAAPSLDAAAGFARISLRVRDRSNGGSPASPPLAVLFDAVEVTGASLSNGSFEADTANAVEFGENSGPLGWTLRSVIEAGLVVAEPTAQDGSAFQFTQLGEGFGDNTLEQCVAVDLDLFSLNVSVWPDRIHPDLRIRLNVDLHANLDDCLARDNRLGRFDTDIRTSDLNRAEWNRLASGGISRPANAGYARIALRARDRSDVALSSPAILLFDDVRVEAEAIGIPVNHPLALWLMILALGGLALRFLKTPYHSKENRS
ncbi:MAG: hypothetical protein ACXIUB_00315 [Wenzhouxiangella sp.]